MIPHVSEWYCVLYRHKPTPLKVYLGIQGIRDIVADVAGNIVDLGKVLQFFVCPQTSYYTKMVVHSTYKHF